MKKIDFPVGISDFSKIRENEYYYIDKTGLICEVLKNPGTEVTLITRPRRFGKTLGMSMLAEFFDIEKDSRKIFQGLEISNHEKLCHAWQNQRPTVFLTFKNVDGLSFDSAYGQLKYEIGRLYEEYAYLLDGEHISDNERQIYERIRKQAAGEVEVTRSLQLLLQLMNKYYGKQAILLLDEYDVPLAKASSHGYYEQMLEVIKAMMTTALKDNAALCFSIVTGCLRISKESIFTGTNNFVLDTITDARLDEYFGFTQKDVDKILSDAGVTECAGQVKEWYDGYHFGECDVYCPWDVMNYFQELQHNPDAKPASYWKNTSDNAVIRSFIDHAGSNITEKFETLLGGGSIVQKVDEGITYDYLNSSEENLWSLLYLTGYLTKAKDDEYSGTLPEETYALKIPNVEIREIFETTIKRWFEDSAKIWDRKHLFDAVWEGDSKEITLEMSKLLRKTISYHDYREDFYHAFLAGIFAGAGYMVESNKEHGEGRSDVVVYDSMNARVAIFEAKYSKSREEMERDCNRAIEQINKKMYASEYEDDYDEILCYGISFFKKRCFVKKK